MPIARNHKISHKAQRYFANRLYVTHCVTYIGWSYVMHRVTLDRFMILES